MIAQEIDYPKFFEEQWRKRFMEKIPCKYLEDCCDDEDIDEDELVDGFNFANRIMIYIKDSLKIVFWREFEEEEFEPPFTYGEDIFEGKGYDMIPEIAKSWEYQDNAIIFSEGKEIFSGHANIGEIISMVIKEQERLLAAKVDPLSGVKR